MVELSKDIVYDSQFNLKTDLYVNEDPNKKKVTIIIIHGGGWFRGSKDSETEIATKFVINGYDVVVPDYRLAPPNFYPTAHKDIEKLYIWVKNQFPENQTVAFGISAGGTMAVELAINYGVIAISLSGIFDFKKWIKNHPKIKPALELVKSDNPEEQQNFNEKFYKGFILNYINNETSLLNKISPYKHVTCSTGPVFLLNSLQELSPVSGVLKMEKALLKHGVICWVHFLPGNRHGRGYAIEVFEEIEQFIRKMTEKSD